MKNRGGKIVLLVALILVFTGVLNLFIYTMSSGGLSIFNFRIPFISINSDRSWFDVLDWDVNIGINDLDGEEIIGGKPYEFEDIDKIIVNTVALDVEIIETDGDKIILTDFTDGKTDEITDNEYKVHSNGDLSFQQDDNVIRNNLEVTGKILLEIPKDLELDYEINTVASELLIDVLYASDISLNCVDGYADIYASGENLEVNGMSNNIMSYGYFERVEQNSMDGTLYLSANADTEQFEINSLSASVYIKLDDVARVYTKSNSLSSGVSNEYININVFDKNSEFKVSSNALDVDIVYKDWE